MRVPDNAVRPLQSCEQVPMPGAEQSCCAVGRIDVQPNTITLAYLRNFRKWIEGPNRGGTRASDYGNDGLLPGACLLKNFLQLLWVHPSLFIQSDPQDI